MAVDWTSKLLIGSIRGGDFSNPIVRLQETGRLVCGLSKDRVLKTLEDSRAGVPWGIFGLPGDLLILLDAEVLGVSDVL